VWGEWIDVCAGASLYSGWSVLMQLDFSLFLYGIYFSLLFVFQMVCCFYSFCGPCETSHWLPSGLPIVRPLLLSLLLGWFPNNTELPSYHITSSIWPEVVRVCAWNLQHLISISVLLSKTLFSVRECVTNRAEETRNWSKRHSGNIYLIYIYWDFLKLVF